VSVIQPRRVGKLGSEERSSSEKNIRHLVGIGHQKEFDVPTTGIKQYCKKHYRWSAVLGRCGKIEIRKGSVL